MGLSERARLQLRDAPPKLQALVTAIVAFLRIDPLSASVAFTVIAGEDFRTIVFDEGRGFLSYEVFEDRQLVAIHDLTWLDD